ncbi:hypothetical protein PR202_ga12261 [Eleusine coracana subsp. coracana]|uniref:Mitochondrial substrate carrier family protein n=1 Tax=Eleusine coracana subsp. coracana TaxID=191504 RepID=A0AAV5CBM7_ELECO|nr:hypothetical protein PR202_ga12261 [Eleusine coracana subsp. coracana]
MRPGSGDAQPPAPALAPRPGPYALYHFGTSGAAVAAATAVTHPLGQLPALALMLSYAFGSTNFAFKCASGIIAGALATALTNPMEVLKVRLQMSTSSTSTLGEVRKVLAQEGLKALWKGVGPAMARAGCLTASQVATYDEAKQALLKWTPFEEAVSATTCGLPWSPKEHTGFHCAYKVVQTEGVKSLYKG